MSSSDNCDRSACSFNKQEQNDDALVCATSDQEAFNHEFQYFHGEPHHEGQSYEVQSYDGNSYEGLQYVGHPYEYQAYDCRPTSYSMVNGDFPTMIVTNTQRSQQCYAEVKNEYFPNRDFHEEQNYFHDHNLSNNQNYTQISNENNNTPTFQAHSNFLVQNSYTNNINNHQNYQQYSKRNYTSSAGSTNVEAKKPKADKSHKGLRHFSMKVCEKVQQKKVTTYNEVADELVTEFGDSDKSNGNEQNIRRRVYDALNVLMAMNIISKDKKEIKWLGLPSSLAQQHQNLNNEGANLFYNIKEKLRVIYVLVNQQIALYNLANCNKKKYGKSIPEDLDKKHIKLPFFSIKTSKDTEIVCKLNEMKTKCEFLFSNDFHISDDVEILKNMGYNCNLDKPECSKADVERALSLCPKNLTYFINAMAGKSLEQFQDHVLSKRGFLANDDLMIFYNQINETKFTAPESKNADAQQGFSGNTQNLNGCSIEATTSQVNTTCSTDENDSQKTQNSEVNVYVNMKNENKLL